MLNGGSTYSFTSHTGVRLQPIISPQCLSENGLYPDLISKIHVTQSLNRRFALACRHVNPGNRFALLRLTTHIGTARAVHRRRSPGCSRCGRLGSVRAGRRSLPGCHGIQVGKRYMRLGGVRNRLLRDGLPPRLRSHHHQRQRSCQYPCSHRKTPVRYQLRDYQRRTQAVILRPQR